MQPQDPASASSPENPPFTCTHSENFPEILAQLNCSLAISTYQAGKVIFISAYSGKLVQLPRSFRKAMGICISGNRMAIATRTEVVILQNTPGLAQRYPKKPSTYDALFVPRAAYFTGELDIHDLHFTSKGLLAVNTRFSCISRVGEDYSFTPVWKPNFIPSLQPEDECHLNGMAIVGDTPKYVTALGETTSLRGWRPNKAAGGILIDVASQEIILRQLPMPHSPRLFGNELYALFSATGELVKVDAARGTYDVVERFDGFVRGMDKIGNILFIGLSKLRTTSSSFNDLPIAARSIICGVAAFDLLTGKTVGYIKYENSVEEIFDVKVLPGMRRPGILNHYKDDHYLLVTSPEGNYWSQPEDPEGQISAPLK